MRRALVALLFACGQIDTSTPPTNVTYTFAMRELFIDVKRVTTGWPFPGAWKDYGANLDGKTTDATSSDVCALFPNGSQVDGTNGIDNSFGSWIVPMMEPEQGSFSDEMTSEIQYGSWTLQIQVVGLSDDPTQTSSGLVARVFASDSSGSVTPPAFDESTSWPVASLSLNDGATISSGAIATFPHASITNGRFVSGPASGPLHWRLLSGQGVDLVLHDASITFNRASRGEARDGTISGVLDLEELTSEMHAIASHVSLSLCGSGFDSLAATYRSMADILRDGTNAPGVPCDGISVGFGFNARLIANPTEVTQVVPVVDLCAN